MDSEQKLDLFDDLETPVADGGQGEDGNITGPQLHVTLRSSAGHDMTATLYRNGKTWEVQAADRALQWAVGKNLFALMFYGLKRAETIVIQIVR